MIKHGHRKNNKTTKTYIIWKNMIQRCSNSRHKYYKDYGGRGIKVCKRWKDSFPNFLEDMNEVPLGYQIDRINNNKGYYKSNCRWTTSKQNNRNRRDNHLETYREKTQCLVVWAEEYKIPYDLLRNRIDQLGWSIKRSLITPVRKYKKRRKK